MAGDADWQLDDRRRRSAALQRRKRLRQTLRRRMRRHDAVADAVWASRRRARHVEIDAGVQSERHAVSCRRSKAAAARVFLLADARCRDRAKV